MTKTCSGGGGGGSSGASSSGGGTGVSDPAGNGTTTGHKETQPSVEAGPQENQVEELPPVVCFSRRVLSLSGLDFQYGDKGCHTKVFHDCLLKKDGATQYGTNCIRIQSEMDPSEELPEEKCDDAANGVIMTQSLESAGLESTPFEEETVEYCFCGTDNCNGKSHGGFGKRSGYSRPKDEDYADLMDIWSGATHSRISISTWVSAGGIIFMMFYYI